MKFINYLESISGVSVYPMIALILFGGVFVIAVFSAFFSKKEDIREQSMLPLDEPK
jgi:TRAP-type C4-dicarboxylate transport system permease small subunit